MIMQPPLKCSLSGTKKPLQDVVLEMHWLPRAGA
jgi:hypothetical protein